MSLELMRIQAETLFLHDPFGRLLGLNEPQHPTPAPYLFVGVTDDGALCRLRRDLPAALCDELCAIVRRSGREAWEEDSGACEELARRLTASGRAVDAVWRGPAYIFPSVIPETNGAVTIDAANAELLGEQFADAAADLPYTRPCTAAMRGGRAVCVCRSVRISKSAAEAGVFTLPGHRGRGHARDAVTAWAAAVRHAGLIPLYSTSFENLASRALARSLGLIPFGADIHLSGPIREGGTASSRRVRR